MNHGTTHGTRTRNCGCRRHGVGHLPGVQSRIRRTVRAGGHETRSDYFEYTVPVNGVTATSRYAWETTGTVANVNLMSTVTAGTAIVTIADDDSALIFTHALDGSGVVGTGMGTAGFWSIHVELTNASGTLHFTVVPQ